MRQMKTPHPVQKDQESGDLLGHIERFFTAHFKDVSRPLRLVCGLSGGSDSMALFHLLKELAALRPLDLTFVHIDHRWRKESGEQAELLKKMCAQHKMRYVGHELPVPQSSKNLEALWRDGRLRIFHQVVKERNASALVLAHHAGDCVETMLKRIFEGAELSQLGAMDGEVYIGPMRIMRPFLTLEKKQLKKWLAIRHLTHFEDPTNGDPKLWRGFVRTQLFSSVQGALGKEIDAPLMRLWRYAKELDKMLDSQLMMSSLPHQFGITGIWSEIPNTTSALLLRHFFRKRAESFESHLPHRAAERLVDAALAKKSNCTVEFGTCRALVWKNLVFFQSLLAKSDDEILRLTDGKEHSIGIWRVRASKVPHHLAGISERGWKCVWKGQFTAILKSSSPMLSLPKKGLKLRGKSATLATWWSKNCVPPPLRSCVPVAMENGEVIDEWLSESARLQETSGDCDDWILNFSALPLPFSRGDDRDKRIE